MGLAAFNQARRKEKKAEAEVAPVEQKVEAPAQEPVEVPAEPEKPKKPGK